MVQPLFKYRGEVIKGCRNEINVMFLYYTLLKNLLKILLLRTCIFCTEINLFSESNVNNRRLRDQRNVHHTLNIVYSTKWVDTNNK